jgi:hypothetical protein
MITSKQIKVSFEGFWPDLNPNAFFVPFVSEALSCEVVVTESSESDLVFTSVFPKSNFGKRVVGLARRKLGREFPVNPKSKVPFQKHIWYTGENLRPPVANYDLRYSFDLDTYGETNAYLPLIFLELDWFENGQMAKSLASWKAKNIVTPKDAASPRASDVADRADFVCAFVGNPEPTRMRALEVLKKIDNVDIYGRAIGRPVTDKYLIGQQYKFMLCFENDLYPGYITEKPLDAWKSGCIPLWWGVDSFGLLNQNALMNAATFDSLEAFVDSVRELNLDSNRLAKMGSEPLFAQEPSLRDASKALQRLFEN